MGRFLLRRPRIKTLSLRAATDVARFLTWPIRILHTPRSISITAGIHHAETEPPGQRCGDHRCQQDDDRQELNAVVFGGHVIPRHMR